MTLINADRVEETSLTQGEGSYTLAGAVRGFRTFSDAIGDGNQCYFFVTDGFGNWESCLGTITGAILTRDVVYSSSNGNSAVNWRPGTKTVTHGWTAAAVSVFGVPLGGTTGQALVKSSGLDGAFGWITLSKSNVGLGNVDNTSDADKPVSTATQTALDLKAPLASPPLSGTPTTPTQDAADNSTKIANTEWVRAYTAAIVQGLNPKAPIRLAVTTNVVIATALENGDTLDGETLATGDRVGLFGQTAPAEVGVYVVVASGAASRATDFDAAAEFPRSTTLVLEGTNTGIWVCTNATNPVVGTDPITFVLFNVSGGSVSFANQAAMEAGASSTLAAAPLGTAQSIDFRISRFNTVAAAEAFSPLTAPNTIEVRNWAAAGDGGGATYQKVGSEPAHEGKLQTVLGTWYEIANDILTPQMFGATGDGATDDTIAVQNWFHVVSVLGRRGYAPKGTYLIKYVAEDNDFDIRIDAHPKAVFKGAVSYQSYVGDGANKVFTITAFDFYAQHQDIVVDLVVTATGASTRLVKITDYNRVGNVVTLTGAAPTAAQTLWIYSSAPIIELSTTDQTDKTTNNWLEWSGGKFDASQRGLANPGASGTCLGNVNRRARIQGVNFYGGAGTYQDQQDAHIGGDSGITSTGSPFLEIFGCYANGLGDAFAYISGQPTDVSTRRGINLYVHDNHAENCQIGIRATRGHKSVSIRGNIIERCHYGILCRTVTATATQYDYVITGNIVTKSVLFAINATAIKSGLIIANNVLTDVGYEIDGVTKNGGGADVLIYLGGCPGAIVSNNRLALRDYAADNGQIGVQIEKANDFDATPLLSKDIRVTNNGLTNLPNGIVETGLNADFENNSHTNNTMRTVTTPKTIQGQTTLWNYTIDGVYAEGVGNIATTVKTGSLAINITVAASGTASSNVTVNGAVLNGGPCRFWASVTLGGLMARASVSANNTVNVRWFNPTGASITVNGTLYASYQAVPV